MSAKTREGRAERYITALLDKREAEGHYKLSKEDLSKALCHFAQQEINLAVVDTAAWISFETDLGPDFSGQIEVMDRNGRIAIVEYKLHNENPISHYLGWLSAPVAWRKVRK